MTSKESLSQEDAIRQSPPPELELIFSSHEHQLSNADININPEIDAEINNEIKVNSGMEIPEINKQHLSLDIDIEDEEAVQYLKLVKTILEAQGIDFEEWKSAMLEAAAATAEQDDQDSWSDGLQDSEERIASGELTTLEQDYEEYKEAEELVKEEKIDIPYVERPVDKTAIMGMKSFRFLETRILAKFLRETDDERMNALRKKLKQMKKVPPPVPFDVNRLSKMTFIHESKKDFSAFDEGDGEGDEEQDDDEEQENEEEMIEDDESIEEEEDDDEEQNGWLDFTDKEWALKNTLSFLGKAGCRSPEASDTDLHVKRKNMNTRLKIFLGRPKVHRQGISDGAPEITAAVKRQAERSMWRAILKNSKPKYPLPRFILPEFRYLRKIEKTLIGPGSYEIDAYYEQQRLKRLKSMPSMFNSCSNRFPKDKWRAPASDSLTDPWAVWDKACEHYNHPGSVPLFQSTPCNFRYKNFYVGCGIPPNYYDIKSPLQEFLHKRRSNRTMFEGSSINDHFCPKNKRVDPSIRIGPGSYDVKGSIIRDLTNSYNIFKGKISKTDRRKMYGFKAAFENPLWPANNGFPGPATYDPYEHEEWMESSWAPFGVQERARKLEINSESKLVAPDYYYYGDGYKIDKGWKPEIFGNGLKSNFLSKTPINTPESRYAALRERNKALNYKLEQETIYRKKDVINPNCPQN